MLFKLSAALFALALSLQVQGHALIEPAIGVTGTPARSDVQQPSGSKPCGQNVDITTALASSTAVKANNGAFTVTVQSFNGGQDGSQQVTATVDPTGTGASFPDKATITKNGPLAPAAASSVQVDVSLPAGTKCTGGSDGASCLVAFKTAGGFGNCVLVSQGSGSAAAAAPPPTSASSTVKSEKSTATSTVEKSTIKATSTTSTAASATVSSAPSAESSSSSTSTSQKKPCKHDQNAKRLVYGARAPRVARGVEAWDVNQFYH